MALTGGVRVPASVREERERARCVARLLPVPAHAGEERREAG